MLVSAVVAAETAPCRLLLPCDVNETLRAAYEGVWIEMPTNLNNFVDESTVVQGLQAQVSGACAAAFREGRVAGSCAEAVTASMRSSLAALCGCVAPWARTVDEEHLRSAASRRRATGAVDVPRRPTVFYINLGRRKDRDAWMRWQLDASRVRDAFDVVRVEAVDGSREAFRREVPNSATQIISRKLVFLSKPYERILFGRSWRSSRARISCGSRRRCWARARTSGPRRPGPSWPTG